MGPIEISLPKTDLLYRYSGLPYVACSLGGSIEKILDCFAWIIGTTVCNSGVLAPEVLLSR